MVVLRYIITGKSLLWILRLDSTVIFSIMICSSTSWGATVSEPLATICIGLLIGPKLGKSAASEPAPVGLRIRRINLVTCGIKGLFDVSSNSRTEKKENMFRSRTDSLSDKDVLHHLPC